MNGRIMRTWELRLGPVQIVVLLGLVLSSMLCSYFLGTYTGHRSGFEEASEKNLMDAPKQPVFSQEYAESDSLAQSPDLFAKLKSEKESGGTVGQAAPKLGVIETTELDPHASDREEARSHSNKTNTAEQVPAKAFPDPVLAQKGSVRVLGAGAGREAEDQKTLGALLKEKEREVTASAEDSSFVPAVKVTPTPSVTPLKLVTLPTRAEAPAEKSALTASAKKPVSQESFLRTSLSKGWYAQVSAPRSLQEANEVGRKLRDAGFAVSVEKAMVRSQEYYRLVVGPEDTRPQAERLVQQLKRESVIRGEPFLRMVK